MYSSDLGDTPHEASRLGTEPDLGQGLSASWCLWLTSQACLWQERFLHKLWQAHTGNSWSACAGSPGEGTNSSKAVCRHQGNLCHHKNAWAWHCGSLCLHIKGCTCRVPKGLATSSSTWPVDGKQSNVSRKCQAYFCSKKCRPEPSNPLGCDYKQTPQ